VVIGPIRAGRQDLRSLVGIGSREHVASEERLIALVISLMLTGEKKSRVGGLHEGGECGDCDVQLAELGRKEDVIFVILSMKNVEKDEAIAEGDV
jgi:hypothetical protein